MFEKLNAMIRERMVKQLSEQGKKLAKQAADTTEPKKQSGNLLDSFGYAVYYEGELQAKGYASDATISNETHRGWKKHGIPENTGRGWLDSWIESYKPKEHGYVLVIVAAAFYGRILEGGYQHEGAKQYRVISQIYSDVERVGDQYKKAMKNNKHGSVTVTTVFGNSKSQN
jgi:hypothetical protein